MSEIDEIEVPASTGMILSPVMDLAVAKARLKQFQEFVQEYLKDGEDFGIIPGTAKPTLYKSGADKLTELYGLSDSYQIISKVEDFDAGLFDYVIECTLSSRSGGFVVATGLGSCSSYESKYRWREGKRKCPQCGQEAIIKGKQEYGGGWLCFAKKGGCGAKYGDSDSRIIEQTIGRVLNEDVADLKNCVTPDTLILTHDLQWIPAGEIETGDMLIGVEENLSSEYARNLAVGEAIVHGRRTDLLYEIVFEDGRKVRCNGEHKWLVKKIGLKGTEWVSTEDIHREVVERKGRPRQWTVMSLCRPWQEDMSKEAGYIAGLFDADGCLEPKQVRVQFAQLQNTVLARIEQGLKDRGYRVSMSKLKTQERMDQTVSGKQVFTMCLLGNFAEQIRLLGSVRPPRLLQRWLGMVDLAKRRLEGRGSGAGKPCAIVSIETAGKGEIVILGTSCHTYIAEGLVCHNTVLKMAKKRSKIDATLSATRSSGLFTQDMEDIKGHIVDDGPEFSQESREDVINRKLAELQKDTAKPKAAPVTPLQADTARKTEKRTSPPILEKKPEMKPKVEAPVDPGCGKRADSLPEIVGTKLLALENKETAKGGAYIRLEFDNLAGGVAEVFCFHKSLFPACTTFLNKQGNIFVHRTEGKDGQKRLVLDDITEIEHHRYEQGKPLGKPLDFPKPPADDSGFEEIWAEGQK